MMMDKYKIAGDMEFNHWDCNYFGNSILRA